MKVFIDPDICMDCVMCVEICPEVFGLSDTGDTVRLQTTEVPEALSERVLLAKQQCPVDAIEIEE